jgi:hypothetical protein
MSSTKKTPGASGKPHPELVRWHSPSYRLKLFFKRRVDNNIITMFFVYTVLIAAGASVIYALLRSF